MRLVTVLILALFVAACATPPSTPRQSVAACYSGVTAAANTAADLYARKQITDAQKSKAYEVGMQALALCDAAQAAVGAGDITKADGALAAASSLLLSVETQLKAR